MKKITAIVLLICCLAIVLVACKDKELDPETSKFVDDGKDLISPSPSIDLVPSVFESDNLEKDLESNGILPSETAQ